MSGVPCGRRAWLTSSVKSSSDESEEDPGRMAAVEAVVIDLASQDNLLVRFLPVVYEVAVELLRGLVGRDVYASAISDELYSSASDERVGEGEYLLGEEPPSCSGADVPTNQSFSGLDLCLEGDGGLSTVGESREDMKPAKALVGDASDALEAVCATKGGSLRVDVQDLWWPFLVGI